MHKIHIAIVGGGISGLTVAYELSRRACRENVPLRISLFEAKDRLGGVIRTLRQGPFLTEAAADAFYAGGAKGRQVLELCGSLGMTEELTEAAPSFRRFFIFKNKKLFRCPALPGSGDPSMLWKSPLLSVPAKARLLFEPWIPCSAEEEDESLGHFFQRRCGRAFYREVALPVIRGVFMAAPEDLSCRAVFPRLLELERLYGSLALAAVRDRPGPRDPGDERFLNFKNGLGSLPQKMARETRDCEFRTGTPVSKWDRDGRGDCLILQNGERVEADATCIAMTAADTASLLRGRDGILAGELETISYDSVLTLNFIFKKEDLPEKLSGPGFFVPFGVGGCPFSSLKGFEPLSGGEDGYRRLRVFISGTMLPEVFSQEDGAVEEKVLGTIREWMAVRAAPVWGGTERYANALPRYGVGHLEKIVRIETRLRRYPRLFLTGNGFRGFGISDCIGAARATARALWEAVQ
ncbi:MAG: protoporphyrinogen oxidase [Candidatus Omnitrophica bacterium]|nr:protoporphyrinogen oxidase [Candidatus Omnitrophota bacterium]